MCVYVFVCVDMCMCLEDTVVLGRFWDFVVFYNMRLMRRERLGKRNTSFFCFKGCGFGNAFYIFRFRKYKFWYVRGFFVSFVKKEFVFILVSYSWGDERFVFSRVGCWVVRRVEGRVVICGWGLFRGFRRMG